MTDLDKILQKISALQTTKRKGWVLHGVPEPESVAEHSYMVTFLTYLLADDAGVDKTKCIRMALFHDFAESVVGDITPYDGISKKEKYDSEKKAMESISTDFGNKEMLDLWMEYAQHKTPESKFVHEIDKLEMVFQAYIYEQKYPEINLDEFWKSVKGKITIPHLKKMYNDLYNMRKKK